jgi:predicted kinase
VAPRELRGAVRRILLGIELPATKLERPLFIILSGLPGTGKSTIAEKVGEALPAIVIQSDFVRKSLFPRPTYAWQESRTVHAVARTLIRIFLQDGFAVISDATNLRQSHRRLLVRMADSTDAATLFVETVAPESVVPARLRKRFVHRQRGDISDANWQIYKLLQASADPIVAQHLQLDTSHPLPALVQRVIRASHRAVKKRARL